MNRKQLAKRYRYLWVGETVNVVLFPAVFFAFALGSGPWTRWLLRGYALTIIVLILIQAVFWWRWKLRVLRAGKRKIPRRVLGVYRRLRSLNWILITAGFMMALAAKWLLVGRLPLDSDLGIGLLLIGFAALEQVNYYYYQLMYDNRWDLQQLRDRGRLRRGSIGKMLEWS